jgi:hypothetical protein
MKTPLIELNLAWIPEAIMALIFPLAIGGFFWMMVHLGKNNFEQIAIEKEKTHQLELQLQIEKERHK